MWNQLGFYKYIRKIVMNTRIRYFQTIYKLISETVMLSHHIILIIQRQDQIPKRELHIELLF